LKNSSSICWSNAFVIKSFAESNICIFRNRKKISYEAIAEGSQVSSSNGAVELISAVS